MANQSAIEWTDSTWNFLKGCTPVSAGCLNCYAAGVAHQKQTHPNPKVAAQFAGLTVLKPAGRGGRRAVFNGAINVVEHLITAPLKWREPRRIFVNSLSDLFHPEVPMAIIDQAFAVMALCPQHTFQILTKRPELMSAYLADGARDAVDALLAQHRPTRRVDQWPLPNVWLGTSVENQAAANARIPNLLRAPAAVHFLSCEPLLGPLTLRVVGYGPSNRGYMDALTGETEFEEVAKCGHAAPPLPRIDWVIAGGESGPHARPMHPDWVRSLRDQCQAAGVPFHFKQWGEHLCEPLQDVDVEDVMCLMRTGQEFGYSARLNGPGGGRWVLWPGSATWGRVAAPPPDAVVVRRVGKKAAGRELDGRTWDEFPGEPAK